MREGGKMATAKHFCWPLLPPREHILMTSDVSVGGGGSPKRRQSKGGCVNSLQFNPLNGSLDNGSIRLIVPDLASPFL